MTTTNRNSITEGSIWKGLLLFFLPIVAGTLLQQVYTMVDMVIIGRFVGTEALAAVGGSDAMVIQLLVNFFVALSSGASILIAQRFGAGETEAVDRALHTAIVLAAAIGAILTVVGVFFADSLLGLMHTPEESMGFAADYLRYYFLGMIPCMIYNMGAGILRSVGDARRPLYFLLACTVANIFLDLLFVVVWKQGVIGAAVATSLSQVLCAALVLICLARGQSGLRLRLSRLRVDRRLLATMLAIGVPAGLQTVFYNITNVMVQAAINSLGTVSAAAWSAFWRMDGFYWPISNAMGLAVMTFVGQNYGAGQKDRIGRTVSAGLALHLLLSVGFALALYLFRFPFVRLFSQDAEVQRQGALIVSYLSAAYPLFTCIEILSSAIRGTGNSLKPTIITLVTVCLLRIAFLAAVTFQNPSHLSISLCYPVTWSVSSLVYVLYYRRGRWMGTGDKARRLRD